MVFDPTEGGEGGKVRGFALSLNNPAKGDADPAQSGADVGVSNSMRRDVPSRVESVPEHVPSSTTIRSKRLEGRSVDAPAALDPLVDEARAERDVRGTCVEKGSALETVDHDHDLDRNHDHDHDRDRVRGRGGRSVLMPAPTDVNSPASN